MRRCTKGRAMIVRMIRLRIAWAGAEARAIADYVAGMTDRFCRHEHERIVA